MISGLLGLVRNFTCNVHLSISIWKFCPLQIRVIILIILLLALKLKFASNNLQWIQKLGNFNLEHNLYDFLSEHTMYM